MAKNFQILYHNFTKVQFLYLRIQPCKFYYLLPGGNVYWCVYLSVCLCFWSLEKEITDLYENFYWYMHRAWRGEEVIKFWKDPYYILDTEKSHIFKGPIFHVFQWLWLSGSHRSKRKEQIFMKFYYVGIGFAHRKKRLHFGKDLIHILETIFLNLINSPWWRSLLYKVFSSFIGIL